MVAPCEISTGVGVAGVAAGGGAVVAPPAGTSPIGGQQVPVTG
ncbi:MULTISPECIES: hypothetical protein [unclassified Frankia]|nr:MULTISPECIES: hypothetical protein [unclassified Frankia]